MQNRLKKFLIYGYTLTLLISYNSIQSKINFNSRKEILNLEIMKEKKYNVRLEDIENTDLERINTNSKTTKRPFLYIWGFDRIEKNFWKSELCKLSRLGIDYVHSYSNFRDLDIEDLKELIITAKGCILKLIFAIQPRENKF